MNIKSIVWIGTRTNQYEQMKAFCRDLLGLNHTFERDGVSFFDLPNGDRFEIFSGDENQTDLMAGFLVEDVEASRAELEEKGVEFIGPVHRNAEGYVWSHFKAPDGNEYSITYFPVHPSG